MVESVVFGLARLAIEPALKKLAKAIQARKAVDVVAGGKMPIVVVEIGRPIVADVKAQFGEDSVVAVISAIKQLEPEEFPRFAADAYKALMDVARVLRKSGYGGEIGLVLSGPVALNFQFGQLVGLSHVRVQVFQWFAGEYRVIPQVRREMLK